jgi:arylsulfatase A-like enzyme
MPERPYDQPNAYIATEYPTLSVLRDLHRRGQLNAAQSLFLAPRKPEFELYDLRRDPHEVHNLAEDRAAQPLLADLRRRLAGWAEETHDRGSLPEDPDELRQARADDAAYGKNTRAQ